jgi:deazaflavin-dependent oxidoreductase (nitroreductase family)
MSTSATGNEYNASIIKEFRASGGRVGGLWENTPLILLHHTGAKSGKARMNPLGYLADGDRYVIAASNGGSAAHPDWYHNLKAHPEVTIEVGADAIKATACEATGEERERLFQAMVAGAPQLAAHQAKTGRLIPVMVLTPARRQAAQH